MPEMASPSNQIPLNPLFFSVPASVSGTKAGRTMSVSSFLAPTSPKNGSSHGIKRPKPMSDSKLIDDELPTAKRKLDEKMSARFRNFHISTDNSERFTFGTQNKRLPDVQFSSGDRSSSDDIELDDNGDDGDDSSDGVVETDDAPSDKNEDQASLTLSDELKEYIRRANEEPIIIMKYRFYLTFR
ncbi:hypothetical protein AB6A40_009384 [Gnathostoma spinigerum]|uniref:Uncharacterized protein n=1 Tax=Gnathostoma spinigerum TaxID=75299 RepID=A0ABD6ET21_9BILA